MPPRQIATLGDLDYTFKIAVVGDSGVGKSALTTRLASNRCPAEHDATIGVDFQTHTLCVDDAEGISRRVKLHIWDTAGQEQFQSITCNYFRNIAGALVVYSVDNPSTQRSVDRWIEQIRLHNGTHAVPVVVCANKADLGEGAEALAMHTSALTGEGVEAAFRRVAELVLAGLGDDEEAGPLFSTGGVRVHSNILCGDDEAGGGVSLESARRASLRCCRT